MCILYLLSSSTISLSPDCRTKNVVVDSAAKSFIKNMYESPCWNTAEMSGGINCPSSTCHTLIAYPSSLLQMLREIQCRRVFIFVSVIYTPKAWYLRFQIELKRNNLTISLQEITFCAFITFRPNCFSNAIRVLSFASSISSGCVNEISWFSSK